MEKYCFIKIMQDMAAVRTARHGNGNGYDSGVRAGSDHPVTRKCASVLVWRLAVRTGCIHGISIISPRPTPPPCPTQYYHNPPSPSLQARGLRFTLLSGDVHCAGIGRLHTHPKMNFKADPR